MSPALRAAPAAQGDAPAGPVHSARRLFIHSGREAVVYLHRDSEVCRSEGFASETRLWVRNGRRAILATLNVVTDGLVTPIQVGLSESAWAQLGATERAAIGFDHPLPLESLRHVRAKVHGQRLDRAALESVVKDIAAGYYSDINLAAFITACAGDRLDRQEISDLTRAMIGSGEQLRWDRTPVLDKHSVGGLPGNRTTLLVVPIVTAVGVLMPKTSSRAITSPSGTADTMEMLAPVDLDVPRMRRVVEQEGGCIVWGGTARLSPADDVLIRVERPLDRDSAGQLVASVLSKKVAAGATHVIIDIPVGATAKVRSLKAAQSLSRDFCAVGSQVGVQVLPVWTDGTQPVGYGIGPALEARDALAVLRRDPGAPPDLRERGLLLAAHVLELSGAVPAGGGEALAREVLNDGPAWLKFQAICRAQGGPREPPNTQPFCSTRPGRVARIDNRRLARVVKLAGAPRDPSAGLVLHARVGASIEVGQPLFTVHAESAGELDYALAHARAAGEIVVTKEAA